MTPRRTTPLLAAAAALALAPEASAGGFARPNPISARGTGMGGAFAAVADDPTALHFNPAGLGRMFRSHVMVGGELIFAPRQYVPIEADGTRGEPQENEAPVRPLPSLGFATRFSSEGIPSRLAFGVGVWNTYGGQLDYPVDEDMSDAIFSSRNAVIEVVPGVAYEVDEHLALGLAARIGIGLFDVDTNRGGTRTEVHTRGLGAGFTAGAMLSPTEGFRIGAVYRSPITVQTSGTATLQLPGGPVEASANVDQRWPQSAALGAAVEATSDLLLSAEVAWTGWARWDSLDVELVGQSDQPTALDLEDSYAVHAGGQYAIGELAEVRAGITHDTAAFPDHTIQRQFLDSDKTAFDLGASFYIQRTWRLDAAFEVLPGIGGARVVPDNSEEASDAGWPMRANAAPGEHSGKLYTLQLALQYLY